MELVLPKFIRKSSPVFKHFLSLESVTYRGIGQDKTVTFDTLKQNQSGKLLMVNIIRKEESELWKSCQELLGTIFNAIESKIRGIFHFEILSVAMNEDWDNFLWREFSKGMTELAHELSVGKSQFVQYCSIFGVLTKYADEDFGKIGFHPQVKIFDKEAEELDGLLLRLIRESQRSQDFKGMKQLVFYDLSRVPLYNVDNQKQRLRLDKMGKKLDADAGTLLTEIFIVDNTGLHPLFQKSQLELF